MEIRDAIVRETRHAARTLLRTPSFSIITLVTLALALGAATAIFTLLDAVVLRPLPYAHAERLVKLSSPVPKIEGQSVWALGRHQMPYFLQHGRTLENLGLYQLSDETVLGGADEGSRSERVRSAQVSASLFQVLSFTPSRGRLFVSDDNSNRIPAVAVLSHGYWQRRFGGDNDVIGRNLDLGGYPVNIVGVLPAGADLPDIKVDVWTPAWIDSTTVWNNHTWAAIGRLKPGFTATDAERDLAPLTNRLPEVFPTVYNPNWIENTGFRTRVEPLRDAVVGEVVTRALWALFGAVALVLLIAAANVANLFLVRLDARGREIALRVAVGADRRHLAWHYLSESLLLALASAAGAVAVAYGMLRVLLALAPSELPRLSEVHLSAASVAFAIGGALLAGVVFGLIPVIGARLNLAMLRDAGRGATSSRRRMIARRALVVTQMAFAVVLLAAAALMVRTFRNLRSVDPGFDARGVLTMEIALPQQRYGRGGMYYFESAAMASGFYEQLADRLRQLPGVRNVGFIARMPLLSSVGCIGINVEGPVAQTARGACPPSTMATPGYFETMGVRVEGRTLDWSGMRARDGAVVVSRAFADHHWPDQNPMGKGLRFYGTNPPFYRVVGVAEDVRGMGLDAPPPQYVYFPTLPIPDAALWSSPTFMHLVLKTVAPNPLALTGTITRIVQELEPQAAVANAQTMETALARTIAKQSFTMVLLVIASAIAMLLSAVGIYGVISYIVAQRRGEIGVRMALGARAPQVTAMVLRQSMGLAALGVAIGLLAAFATTRVMSALLFGVQPDDPATLAIVPLILLAIAALGTYAPARRAAHIDPAEALRSE